MTIGEMIEAYANFDKTREFYNLYKEAVTVDLKVRYALTESYMQESSIDAILEAGDLWGSIKGWAIKAWEAIKKFFKNIWFHITRFFHSIFNRSDKWYKLEAEYKKIIHESYAIAVRKLQGTSGRKDATDVFEDAVLEAAKDYGIYSGKETRISDKMPEDIIKDLKFLSKVAKGDKPNTPAEGTLNTPAEGTLDILSTSTNAPANTASNSNYSIMMLNEINDYINKAYDSGVGFKVDEKRVDAICQVLGENKINDKVESLADILNVTCMICKPPLNFQISEMFDMFIRGTESLVSKIKNKLSTTSDVEKASYEIMKLANELKKSMNRSKNYFIDIIVDDKFIKKLTDTKRELDETFKKIQDLSNDQLDQGGISSNVSLGERDKKRRGGVLLDFRREGESTAGTTAKKVFTYMDAKAIPELLKSVSEFFSNLTGNITNLNIAVGKTAKFRLSFANLVKKLINEAR